MKIINDNKNICPDGIENLDVHMNEFWQRLTACSDIPLDRFKAICDAERDGRCVITPELGELDYEGLKGKYNVYKARNNEPVYDCFVLRPKKDPAAVAALTAYAKATDNKQLAEDILNWTAPDEKAVVLPCKVGTRVWVIGQNCDLCRDMYAEEPCLFGSCEYKEVFESVFGYGMIDNFGKTVFLTRAEAEAALKGAEHE
jgi:hypothetical protein